MRSHKYIRQFFSRKSWRDIVKYMPLRLNLKEITEVMAVWNVARKYADDCDFLVDVGSGKYSSLGVLAAFSCKTIVSSVDPRKDFITHKGIDRYAQENRSLKETWFMSPDSRILLLSCHGHQPLKEVKEFLARYKSWVYITMPCCVDNRLPGVRGEVIIDPHVWSEKNTIYIYKSRVA